MRDEADDPMEPSRGGASDQKTLYWQRAEEIYLEALPLDGAGRAALLAEACAGNERLHKEVSSLLKADETVGDFLQAPVFALGLQMLADENLDGGGADSELTKLTSDPLIGVTVAGRYRITEPLGEGGFGNVYKARDLNMHDRPVVIKVPKERVLQSSWAKRKFQQEIEALAKIADPGVVGIFDKGELPDGRPFLVMEFVEGETLRQVLKAGRLPLSKQAEIVRQVGRSLSVAHSAGIIHRDLKPENIMLRHNAGGDLQVKVIDFGIAKVAGSSVTSSTETGLMAGTHGYMSPEQLLSKKVTPASDIYTLGIIAYEMATGCLPFNPETRAQLHELQRAGVKVGPKDLRPGLPAAADQIIRRALSYSPTERYRSARDFGDKLAQALTDDIGGNPEPEPPPESGVRVGPMPVPESFFGLGARAPLLLAAAVVMVVVVLILVTGPHSREAESQPPFSPPGPPPPAVVYPERTLTYWLRVHSHKKQAWVSSTGTETFFTGERFYLVAKPAQDGALYVIGRGKEDDGSIGWTSLFPTPDRHDGGALLKAGTETPATEPSRFAGTAGREELIIIWADKPIEWLEAFFKEPYADGAHGAEPHVKRRRLGEEARKRVQDLIDTVPRAETVFDEEKSVVTIKGRGEVLVSVRTLSHKKNE